MPDFNYQRTNFQLNLDTKITNRFTIGAQVSGRYEKTNDVGLPGGDGYYSAILAVFKMRPIDSPYAMIILIISEILTLIVTDITRLHSDVTLPVIKIA